MLKKESECCWRVGMLETSDFFIIVFVIGLVKEVEGCRIVGVRHLGC